MDHIYKRMNPLDIKLLIKEEVTRARLEEILSNFENLHAGISTSSLIGNPWFKLVSSLETVVDEVKDFRGMYSSTLHGPTPNVVDAMQKLQQIIQLLNEIKPTILGMDEIQRKDV